MFERCFKKARKLQQAAPWSSVPIPTLVQKPLHNESCNTVQWEPRHSASLILSLLPASGCRAISPKVEPRPSPQQNQNSHRSPCASRWAVPAEQPAAQQLQMSYQCYHLLLSCIGNFVTSSSVPASVRKCCVCTPSEFFTLGLVGLAILSILQH